MVNSWCKVAIDGFVHHLRISSNISNKNIERHRQGGYKPFLRLVRCNWKGAGPAPALQIDFYFRLLRHRCDQDCHKSELDILRRGFAAAAASITTIVWEEHPGSHHKGATGMHTHSAIWVGFELATDGIRFYCLCHKLEDLGFRV